MLGASETRELESGVLNLGAKRGWAAVSLKKLTSLLIFAILLLSVFAYIILYKP